VAGKLPAKVFEDFLKAVAYYNLQTAISFIAMACEAMVRAWRKRESLALPLRFVTVQSQEDEKAI
jgi:hypothetical protein